MTDYAIMADKVFSTRGEVKMKKKMSPERNTLKNIRLKFM